MKQQSKQNRGILYLGGPYTHPDARVREFRYKFITLVAADLIAKGRIVFSPLTMTHPIDKILAEANDTLGSNYWLNFDEAFMEFCSELAILTIDGWQQSSGVAREIQFFEERRRSVKYLSYKNSKIEKEMLEKFETL